MLYKKTITNDNSITFFNKQYDEHYHSIVGAKTEALKKFIYPSSLKERCEKGKVKILDVTFGLGYNSLCALDVDGDIQLTAIELDKDSCFLLLEEHVGIDNRWKNVLTSLKNSSIYSDKGKSIELIIGDARQVVKSLKETYDIIFLDPFSPYKNPELWTLDFFRCLYKILDENGIIVTYSSALPVLAGLRKAGFHIGHTPPVGRTRGGIFAVKHKYDNGLPISDKDEFLLRESTGMIPFRDKKLNKNKEEILEYRQRLIKKVLSFGKIKTIKQCYKLLEKDSS